DTDLDRDARDRAAKPKEIDRRRGNILGRITSTARADRRDREIRRGRKCRRKHTGTGRAAGSPRTAGPTVSATATGGGSASGRGATGTAAADRASRSRRPAHAAIGADSGERTIARKATLADSAGDR